MAPGRLRSIGAVLPILKSEFPDISISKIRFLEGEGLVSPERAPSGYRKYSSDDIERLRYILRMQRDYYLPLRVIRERLEMLDRGVDPPLPETPQADADGAPSDQPTLVSSKKRAVKLTKRELIQMSGISEANFVELERQQMVAPRKGTGFYGQESLLICLATRKLRTYGMDIRHLRAIKQCSEREAGLVEAVVAPLHRASSSTEALQEVTQLVIHAHAALMYTILQN